MRIDANVRIAILGDMTYQVATPEGTWIVRLARDDAHLSLLEKEARVQCGLRDRITLLIPDTRVVRAQYVHDDLDGWPAFAIHKMIPGQPLTSDLYAGLSPEARCRLVVDLAIFFDQTHRIPLPVACEWLNIPFEEAQSTAWLASAQGKPTWFSPDAVAQIRPALMPLLDISQRRLFEDTVNRFEALETHPEYLVFGHGDMHGYNMALGKDELGAKLVGVFDLGCAGLLDAHEDFFRLSLIDEELLDAVIEAYQRLTGHVRSLERDRLAIYYRAFLFYLMVGKADERLAQLTLLLHKHIAYSRNKYSPKMTEGRS